MKPTAVIFDMDGTLADTDGIMHYILDLKDIDAYHRASNFTVPNQGVLDFYHDTLAAGHAVVVLTARPERWRFVTSGWLAKHNIRYEALLMRPDGDDRPDDVIKKEMLDRIQEKFTVVHAIDDNPSVVALWVRHGIPTTVVVG